MRYKNNQVGIAHLFIFLFIPVLLIVAFAGYRVINKNKSSLPPSKILSSNASPDAKAIAAGKSLSSNQCSGSGETTFTHLPMNPADFSILIPYGETVGGHVTPIDHQYFSPTIFNSPKDKYPVYAMADAKITNLEIHPPENGSNGRIRLVFTVSCTFDYYYDLVTSIEPGIKSGATVKAGQLIGHIGGQTLDFAVWNTKKPLSGFVNPASYDAESWKIYTADPFPYFTPELKSILLSKDPRQAPPRAGKIDYDIDGKLIGNWFLEGSGGYHAPSNHDKFYWSGHLSIAPDLYDPSATVISVGNYNVYPGTNPDTSSGDGSAARQFFAMAGSTNPAKVGIASGAVKYELVQHLWLTADGSSWNGSSYAKSLTAKTNGQVLSTVLVQMKDKGHLEFEAFPGKTGAQVSSFDNQAKIYVR